MFLHACRTRSSAGMETPCATLVSASELNVFAPPMARANRCHHNTTLNADSESTMCTRFALAEPKSDLSTSIARSVSRKNEIGGRRRGRTPMDGSTQPCG